MKIYIKDTTSNPQAEKVFGNYREAVNYLEGVCLRGFGQPRKTRMLLLEEIGHGYDDPNSVNFVRSMAEKVEMGVVREGRRMRCDITALLYDKEEYGN